MKSYQRRQGPRRQRLYRAERQAGVHSGIHLSPPCQPPRLITGATGTGKTVTLQGLAEGFSDQGVPVFCVDVKGDLSGVAEAGEPKPWIETRAKEIGFTPEFRAYPVIFWDVFSEQGHPIRATVAQLGPLLLSQLMGLSEAQKGVLNIAFKIADEEKLPLVDLENLRIDINQRRPD